MPGRFLLPVSIYLRSMPYKPQNRLYTPFKVLGIYLYRQRKAGLVGAVRAHRDRGKNFEEVLRKGLTRFGHWIIWKCWKRWTAARLW